MDASSHPYDPEISVVIPAFNERDSLPALLGEVCGTLRSIGHRAEIVIVDDGSTDGTPAWLYSESQHRPMLRVIHLPQRRGQSAALAAGFARSRGAVIVTLDADLQNDPADIPRLLAALEHADVVSGIRRQRRDPWVRRWASHIANHMRRLALGDTLSDMGCALKAYRRDAIEGIPMFSTVHRFLPALCQLRGARVVEVEVAHRPRLLGTSKYGVTDRLGRGAADLIGVRWLRTRLLAPLPRPDRS